MYTVHKKTIYISLGSVTFEVCHDMNWANTQSNFNSPQNGNHNIFQTHLHE